MAQYTLSELLEAQLWFNTIAPELMPDDPQYIQQELEAIERELSIRELNDA